MLLDFDPAMTAVASQPFWLYWHDGRRRRRHAPDFLARLVDGTLRTYVASRQVAKEPGKND